MTGLSLDGCGRKRRRAPTVDELEAKQADDAVNGKRGR